MQCWGRRELPVARRALFVAVGALVLLPHSAGASTLDGGIGVRYTAAPGELNLLEIRWSAGTTHVSDPGAVIQATGDCQVVPASGGHRATCEDPEEPPDVDVAAGDMPDAVSVDVLREDYGISEVTGGPGDDSVHLAAHGPIVAGDDGNDVLEVRGYRLSTYGRPFHATGAPAVSGGSGNDRLTAHSAGVPSRDESAVGAFMAGGDGDDMVTGATTDDDVHGGAGVDTLSGGGGRDSVHGGEGDDSVDGGDGDDYAVRGEAGTDVVRGGAGLDSMSGGDGNDALDGGEGDDYMDGAAGADVIDGGPGTDEAGYFTYMYGQPQPVQRSAPVRVTLDGLPNDGEVGEGDNFARDLEHVRGGGGDDVLIGNERTQWLGGQDGDDVVVGAGGGGDILAGDDGDDTLYGLDGGINEPPDWYPAIRLTEVIDDEMACGSGTDTAFMDPDDERKGMFPTRDYCERIFMADALSSVRIAPGAVIPVEIQCPAEVASVCAGGVTLALATKRAGGLGYTLRPRGLLAPARSRRLGAKSFRIRRGRTGHVRVRMSPRGRRLVGGRRRVGAWITFRR